MTIGNRPCIAGTKPGSNQFSEGSNEKNDGILKSVSKEVKGKFRGVASNRNQGQSAGRKLSKLPVQIKQPSEIGRNRLLCRQLVTVALLSPQRWSPLPSTAPFSTQIPGPARFLQERRHSRRLGCSERGGRRIEMGIRIASPPDSDASRRGCSAQDQAYDEAP
jgi:hypothetical protein